MPVNNNLPDKPPRLWLRFFGLFLLVAAIVGTLGYIKYMQIGELTKQASAPIPATKVTAFKTISADWHNRISAIGSLVALQGVNITSEVDGIINKINFSSGQKINKGEVLLSLSNDVESSAVETAKAQVFSANSRYRRNLKLRAKKLIPAFEIDEMKANLNEMQSQLKSAKAALGKKTIKAPFSGDLGIKNIDTGDYISPGSQIVSLQSIDKLYLDFNLPEQFFTQVFKGQKLNFKVNSYPDEIFTGTVEAWDPILDESTRNVRTRAIVDNANRKLVPGMFAKISVESKNKIQVFTVPESAIFYNIYGEAVYVLTQPKDKDGNKSKSEEYVLEARKVKVLYRKNDVAGVKTGLMPDELVVTSGQLKLYPGLKVAITKDAKPFKKSSEK